MKIYAIFKAEKLICKRRFQNINSIKKYLKENNFYGQYTIIKYNLKGDHDIYKLINKKVDKDELL